MRSLTKRGLEVKDVSEVGVTRGLVAWYPLIGDTVDLVNDSSIGSTHTTGYVSLAGHTGANFEKTGYFSFNLDSPIPGGSAWTFGCAVLLRDFTSSSSYPIFMSDGLPYLAVDAGGNNLRCSYSGGGQVNASSSASLIAGQWHAVMASYTPGQGVKLYLDGSLVGQLSNEDTAGLNDMRVGGHGGKFMINGLVRDVRIHNVALTPEEVAIQAKLALNQQTKSAITSNCLYTKGQIKEVIA